jgi:hypothetical protein
MTAHLKKVLGLSLAFAVAASLPAFGGDCGGCGGKKKDKETKPEEQKLSAPTVPAHFFAGDCGGCGDKKDKETKPEEKKA